MSNLLRHLFSRNAVFTAACVLLLGGFEYLLCAILATIDVAAGLQSILASAPPLFRSMIGERFMDMANLKVFGWTHPVALAIGAALAIVLGARAVAGEIENGAVEMVMSQPISRATYYLAQIVHGCVALLLVSAGGIAGAFAGQSVYDIDKFGTNDLLLLGLNYFLLQLSWFAVTLALSSFARESGRVASVAFFVALVAFIVRTIGDLWDRTAWALPYTFYNYFSPKKIVVDHAPDSRDFVLLAVVSLVALAIGGVKFQKRDLP
jgi:ABC-2 type transport system permease protein